jgi:hypothetical protein
MPSDADFTFRGGIRCIRSETQSYTIVRATAMREFRHSATSDAIPIKSQSVATLSVIHR